MIYDANSFTDYQDFKKNGIPKFSNQDSLISQNGSNFFIQLKSNGSGIIVNSALDMAWNEIFQKMKEDGLKLINIRHFKVV